MTRERNFGRYSPQQVEEFYASGQWADENFTELLRARAESAPDKIFVTDGAQELTFMQLYDKSQRLALGLHRSGLRAATASPFNYPTWGSSSLSQRRSLGSGW